GVDERGDLDAIPDRHGQPFEVSTPHRPLPRQRLDHGRELWPVEREPRAGNQLGDASTFGGDALAEVELTVVEALDQQRRVRRQEWPDQSRDEMRAPLGEVGVLLTLLLPLLLLLLPLLLLSLFHTSRGGMHRSIHRFQVLQMSS
ncbi:MAG: hypothetical protein MOP48_426, partial [Nitrososphaera sp.]|nr:hypothetical protein [Nitrososphaera sp.]